MKTVEKPRHEEREIICNWIEDDGKIVGDDACERINSLVETYFVKMGFSGYGAWETLYMDPEDGRYWERTYPHGERHGGGPPALINLTEAEAKKKYAQIFDKS